MRCFYFSTSLHHFFGNLVLGFHLHVCIKCSPLVHVLFTCAPYMIYVHKRVTKLCKLITISLTSAHFYLLAHKHFESTASRFQHADYDVHCSNKLIL